MSYAQAITPNPDVPCKPGWCLTYVDDAFNLKAHGKTKNYPTAISAWNASSSQHKDRDFPADRWVPLWFTLKNEPAGHVAILAPDGAVWSSSHPTSDKPVRHGSLNEIINYYGSLGLTFIGWTEDVGGVKVLTNEGGSMSNITKDEAKALQNVMRVLNSEAKGWDRTSVHAGKNDAKEVEYLAGMGTSAVNAIARYAQQAWDEGKSYRANKDTWLAAFNEKPGLQKQIEDLKKRVKELEAAGTAEYIKLTDIYIKK